MLDKLQEILGRIADKLEDLGVMGADSQPDTTFTIVQADGREVTAEWIGATVAEALSVERTATEQEDPEVQKRDEQYKQSVDNVLNNINDYSQAVYNYGDGIDSLTKTLVHIEDEQTNIENKQLSVLESIEDTFTAMHEAQELERARASVKHDTDIVGPYAEGGWLQKALATMSAAMSEFQAGMNEGSGSSGGWLGGWGGDGKKKKRRGNRGNRGGPGGNRGPGGPGGPGRSSTWSKVKKGGRYAAAAATLAILSEAAYQKVTDKSLLDLFSSDDEQDRDTDTAEQNTAVGDAPTSNVDASTSTADVENNATFADIGLTNEQMIAGGITAAGAVGVARHLAGNADSAQPVVTGPGDIVGPDGRRLPGPNAGNPDAGRPGTGSKILGAGGKLLRGAGYLGTAVMAADVAMTAFDPNITTEEKTDKAVVAASGLAGGWGGAAAGAAIGTAILPGVGTVIGGLLGGAFGSYFAASVAETAVNDSEEYKYIDQQLLDLRKFEEIVKYRNPEGYDDFVSNNDALEELRDEMEDADADDVNGIMQRAEELITSQIENIERFEEPEADMETEGGYSQLQDPVSGNTMDVPKYTPSNDQRTPLDESIRYGGARSMDAGFSNLFGANRGMSNVPTAPIGPTASATSRGSSSRGGAPTLDDVGGVPGGLPGLHDQYTASS